MVLYMKIYVNLWEYLAVFILEWEIFQAKVVEKLKTHFMSNNSFVENRAGYEILWKNKIEPDKPQMTI